jgi:hypothetical protein
MNSTIKNMNKKTVCLLFPVIFIACVKDRPNTTNSSQVQLSGAKKVYIVNEGGFTNGNASISLFDPFNNQVIEDIYYTQNASTVGDVAQSLSFVNGSYYIVVNNSDKILVCDNQFKKVAQIKGLGSPRYLLPITNQKAYVSDYQSNAISVVDLNLKVKTASIPCSGWTEKMVLVYNKAFVTNVTRQYIYVVNTVSDLIFDSVLVGIDAASIVMDKQDKIWVLSAGDKKQSILARLSRINPLTNQIEISFSFNNGDAPRNLCLNKTKDTLYFLNNDIYRMAISEINLPSSSFINKGNKNFYGLGVNPNDYNIYAADALDYSQKSNIYIFDSYGNEKSVFKAGINANGFYFE